jgi:hypothetical protein
MSRAAEHSPTPTPAPSSAPTTNMPAVLNREPSQQDLEIARQLQSFQSQGVTSHEASKPDANTQTTPQSLTQLAGDSQTQLHPDQDSRDPQQQNSPSPYPPAAQFTPLPQQQQRTPQGSAGNNGQICRYAPIQSNSKAEWLTKTATAELPKRPYGDDLRQVR